MTAGKKVQLRAEATARYLAVLMLGRHSLGHRPIFLLQSTGQRLHGALAMIRSLDG